MKIWTKNVDKQNYLDPKYGMNTHDLNTIQNNRVVKSFHVGWENLPHGTKYLALIMVDNDAIPVCGFPWIHWTVANINISNLNELPENASIDFKNKIVQGKTSWASPFMGKGQVLESGYGGCAPPDKDHTYMLVAYALNEKINIQDGFFLNDLFKKMENHILGTAQIHFNYKKLEK